MTGKVRNLIAEVSEAKDKQKDAEIRALEAQINPHFLYNTLDLSLIHISRLSHRGKTAPDDGYRHPKDKGRIHEADESQYGGK